MDLMEYQVKELLAQQCIPIKKGFVINDLTEIEDAEGKESITASLNFPLVIKAQVQTGGRGKAGGIRFASDKTELLEACQAIFGMNIKGHLVKKLLVVEKAEINQEWYLSIMLDRLSKSPVVIFSSLGGMDIEETAKNSPDKVVRVIIDPLIGLREYVARYLLGKCGLNLDQCSAFHDLLKQVYSLFCSFDCTLVEINPLAVIEGEGFVALDGKVTVDDSALFRQPIIKSFRDELQEDELMLAARRFNFLYIPCEADGNIAVMSNGSGLIMSCIDLISQCGMKVGAALDLGGGATAGRIKEAISIVLSNPRIKALFINIFGGITRCDEVAEGVEQAIECQPDPKLIIVRFEGTNRDKGMQILSVIEGQIIAVDNVADGVNALAIRRNLQ
jgi:succinyl-CoA synthetase beta subunit